MTKEELKQEAEEHKEVDWEGFDINKKDLKQAFLAGLKAGRNSKEGETYELRMKITELQELLTDCLFYCFHVDPYYHECLEEDEIFTRAEKLGVKYNV